MKAKDKLAVINTDVVRSRMIVLRDCPVLLDRDVAELYGVQTKEVNQAVRNNPDKFPDGFLFQLDAEEIDSLRSKILTLNEERGRGKHSKHGYKAFTERGLYMLATIESTKTTIELNLAVLKITHEVTRTKNRK